jgi:SynChlorMet cassette protein ScmC
MPPATPIDTDLYCLTVGNGLKWRLRPVGDEATDVVLRLATVMTLSRCSQGHEILVRVQEGVRQLPVLPWDPAPGICILSPDENDATKILQMIGCATTLAVHLLPHGGLLIHGALVEKDGYGVILAGPGTVGKSTACRRIPPPWNALSDDATLVINDGHGRYLAYPWPTWSRFFDNGPGGTWDVGKAVPLKALFFLHQSPEDRTEPVNMTQSTAWVVESTHQVMWSQMRSRPELSDVKGIYALEIRAAEQLVRSIPIHLLHISLTGKFWEEIERALPGMTSGHLREDQEIPENETVLHSEPASSRIFGPWHIPILYTGPSMNPTLTAPDLLDVVPYEERKPAVGDIICFTRPGDEKNIVHRIIRITGSGIQTQGDNNFSADSDFLKTDHIIGRVIGATRGKHQRKIAGGTLGRFTHLRMLIRKSALNKIWRLLHLAKPALVITRASSHLLPGNWKPRIVIFSSRNTRILRLFFGASIAGEFNTTQGIWTIRFPFRFLVNETTLPTVERPERMHLQNIAPKPPNLL